MKIKLAVGFFIFLFFVFMSSLLVSGIVSRELDGSNDSGQNVQDEQTEARVLSAEIVAKHSSQSDCWTIIDGVVYDITSYVSFHPGGLDTILQACGVDATEDFHTKGGKGNDHLPSTTTLLQSYLIGKIGDEVQVSIGQEDKGSTAGTGGPIVPANLPEGSTPTENSGNSGIKLDAQTVASHNSVNDCYIIVNNVVYNITSYIPFHPGGTSVIAGYCGGEATDAFNTKGGKGSAHSSTANSLLANYRVGNLNDSVSVADTNIATTNPTTNAAPAPTSNASNTSTGTGTSVSLTSAEVARHNSQSDCWFIYNGSVYDVTAYIPFHPGGTSRIVNTCGGDATVAFDTRGGSGTHSTNAKNTLQNYLLGPLGGTSTSSSGTSNTNGGSSGTSSTGYATPEAAIQASYPGATITKVEFEDDGRKSVKFKWNGKSYEAKLDASNNITKVDD